MGTEVRHLLVALLFQGGELPDLFQEDALLVLPVVVGLSGGVHNGVQLALVGGPEHIHGGDFLADGLVQAVGGVGDRLLVRGLGARRLAGRGGRSAAVLEHGAGQLFCGNLAPHQLIDLLLGEFLLGHVVLVHGVGKFLPAAVQLHLDGRGVHVHAVPQGSEVVPLPYGEGSHGDHEKNQDNQNDFQQFFHKQTLSYFAGMRRAASGMGCRGCAAGGAGFSSA